MQRYSETIIDRQGNALQGIVGTVYLAGTETLATIYGNNGVSVISGSTVTSDLNGEIEFWAADGTYDMKKTKTGVVTRWTRGIQLSDQTTHVVDVTSYGARGNGTTDDTAAIQAAFTACTAAGGGTVLFPPGTYSVDGTLIVLGSNTRVSGYGATLKLAAGSYSSNAYFFGTKASFSYESGTPYTENVVIEGIKIDGNISNVTTSASCSGIVAHQVENFAVRDCEILNLPGETGGGYGIFIGYSYRALVDNCNISRTDRQNIIVWETTEAVVDNCVLDYSYYRGCIAVSSNSAPSLQQSEAVISNTYITNASTGTSPYNRGIRFSSGGSGSVIGCHIDATDDGIYITDAYEKDVKILGTVIENCTYGVKVATGVAKKVTVSGCSIADCEEGIYVSAGGGWISVVGNTIEGSTADALTLSYADYIVAVGNVLDGGGFVSIRPNELAVVSDNIITNMTGASYSLLLSDGSGGVANVNGNILEGNTADKAYILTSGQVSLTGAGSPESNITAQIGATYTRSDGGVSTTLYVKETGTGGTGWVPVGAGPLTGTTVATSQTATYVGQLYIKTDTATIYCASAVGTANWVDITA